MTAWLKPPYYTPDPQIRVNCGTFFGSQPTAESEMQLLAASLLGYPAGFMRGAAGSGASTPEQLTNEIVSYAKSFMDSPITKLIAANFDAVARGTFYAELIIAKLKEIPAAPFNWVETGSVYDVWTRAK